MEKITLQERIERLLSVKSLVTIILTIVFSYLAIIQTINAEQVMTIFTTIIAFYFGTQATKE
ncbi:MAG: hypothetical protein EOL95_12035 [Bacteroidia bacterium]|nr:hypothetical protein [Bacteroidia bacterium]